MVDRCICTNRTFKSLVEQATAERLTLEDLSVKAGCGTHCGWCVAYLRRALQTGETSFHELLPKEDI